MKKNILQQVDGVWTPVTVDMTAEEEAALAADMPGAPPEALTPEERMDEIEAAMMELAAMLGGGA